MIQAMLLLTVVKTVSSFCLNYTFASQPGILGTYFSPDQTTFALTHTQGTVAFWDKNNRTLKYTYLFGAWVDRVTYSRNGKYIAIAGTKNGIQILNSTTYTLITTLNTNLGGTVYKADFRYDNNMLLACGYNNMIQIYNIPSWTLNKSINTGSSIHYDCQYAPDGKFVVGGYFGVLTYDINGIKTSTYSFNNLNRIAISADSQYFMATTDSNKYLYGTWNNNYTFYNTNYSTYDSDYSQDSKYLVIGASNGKILLYNASTNNLLTTISTGMAGGIYGTRLTQDSRYLLSAIAATGQVYLYYRSDYYYLNCTQICGDLKAWTLPCDNQFNMPYDGCDNTCQVMTDFTCWINNTVTTCSYNGLLNIELINITHSQDNINQFNLTIHVFPQLYAFKITNNQQFISMFAINNINIINIIYDTNLSQFTFIMQTTGNIINQTLLITYIPTNNPNPIYSKGQTQYIYIPLNQTIMYYYPQIYQKITVIMNYSCHIILALGIFSLIISVTLRKLAGIQSMMVLQFSWLNFIWINSKFIMPFSAIQSLKYTFGYNIHIIHENDAIYSSNSNPPYFSQFHINSHLLINNYTFWPSLLLLCTFLAIVSYFRYKILNRSNSIVANQSILSTQISQIQYSSKIKLKYYKYFSYLLMCVVMVTLIGFVETSINFFINKWGAKTHYQSLTIFFIVLLIITIVFTLYLLNGHQFQYLKISFNQQRYAQQHYILFAILVIISVFFLILLPQYPWTSLIPLIILVIITLVNRPYIYLKQNFRSTFNLLVMCGFVGFRVYANYTKDINCIQTYIFLILLVIASLFIVVIVSSISIIYSWECETQLPNPQSQQQEFRTKAINSDSGKVSMVPVELVQSKSQYQKQSRLQNSQVQNNDDKASIAQFLQNKTQNSIKTYFEPRRHWPGLKMLNEKVNLQDDLGKKTVKFFNQCEKQKQKTQKQNNLGSTKSSRYLSCYRLKYQY